MVAFKRKTDAGRTMVELIGLLSIVGVTMIGGIATYSWAIQRYRVDESYNAVSVVVAGGRSWDIVDKFGADTINSDGGFSPYIVPIRQVVSGMKFRSNTTVEEGLDPQQKARELESFDTHVHAPVWVRAEDDTAWTVRIIGLNYDMCMDLLSGDLKWDYAYRQYYGDADNGGFDVKPTDQLSRDFDIVREKERAYSASTLRNNVAARKDLCNSIDAHHRKYPPIQEYRNADDKFNEPIYKLIKVDDIQSATGDQDVADTTAMDKEADDYTTSIPLHTLVLYWKEHDYEGLMCEPNKPFWFGTDVVSEECCNSLDDYYYLPPLMSNESGYCCEVTGDLYLDGSLVKGVGKISRAEAQKYSLVCGGVTPTSSYQLSGNSLEYLVNSHGGTPEPACGFSVGCDEKLCKPHTPWYESQFEAAYGTATTLPALGSRAVLTHHYECCADPVLSGVDVSRNNMTSGVWVPNANGTDGSQGQCCLGPGYYHSLPTTAFQTWNEDVGVPTGVAGIPQPNVLVASGSSVTYSATTPTTPPITAGYPTEYVGHNPFGIYYLPNHITRFFETALGFSGAFNYNTPSNIDYYEKNCCRSSAVAGTWQRTPVPSLVNPGATNVNDIGLYCCNATQVNGDPAAKYQAMAGPIKCDMSTPLDKNVYNYGTGKAHSVNAMRYNIVPYVDEVACCSDDPNRNGPYSYSGMKGLTNPNVSEPACCAVSPQGLSVVPETNCGAYYPPKISNNFNAECCHHYAPDRIMNGNDCCYQKDDPRNYYTKDCCGLVTAWDGTSNYSGTGVWSSSQTVNVYKIDPVMSQNVVGDVRECYMSYVTSVTQSQLADEDCCPSVISKDLQANKATSSVVDFSGKSFAFSVDGAKIDTNYDTTNDGVVGDDATLKRDKNLALISSEPRKLSAACCKSAGGELFKLSFDSTKYATIGIEGTMHNAVKSIVSSASGDPLCCLANHVICKDKNDKDCCVRLPQNARIECGCPSECPPKLITYPDGSTDVICCLVVASKDHPCECVYGNPNNLKCNKACCPDQKSVDFAIGASCGGTQCKSSTTPPSEVSDVGD